MGARCVFCEKQKQSRKQGDQIDALVLCIHRYVVSCVFLMFQPKAHDLVHTSGHDRRSTAGEVCRAQPPGSPPRRSTP